MYIYKDCKKVGIIGHFGLIQIGEIHGSYETQYSLLNSKIEREGGAH